MKSTLKSHPVLAYFVLTFVISWGGVLILGAPHGMPTTSQKFEQLYPVVFLPYLLGPLVSSLILTGVIDGRAGFRELLARLTAWRISFKWYVIASLTAPVLILGVLGILSLRSSAYLPALLTVDDKTTLLLTGLAIGFFGGGLMEEPGWTGFAVPKLRERSSVLRTGLLVGFVWGAWHFLPTYWGSGDASGALSLALLLPPLVFYTAVLPAYRLLMVWVFERTASLLVVMLMHASLTASSLFILAPQAQGTGLVLYYLILAGLLWAAAGTVLLRMENRSRLETAGS